jgi:hypothetical protein
MGPLTGTPRSGTRPGESTNGLWSGQNSAWRRSGARTGPIPNPPRRQNMNRIERGHNGFRLSARGSVERHLISGCGVAGQAHRARQHHGFHPHSIEHVLDRSGRHPKPLTEPEIAPSHSITSSAVASRDGGTVMPSALAVLRFITSSNLVGCSMGRSPGLVPCGILST